MGPHGAGGAAVGSVAVADHDLVYDNPNRRRMIQIGILVAAVAAAVLLVWALFAMTRPPSTGPESTMVTIPILENQTEEDATEKLEELELEVVVEEESSTDVEVGRVIGTDPDAGEEVEKGSTVTLKVSLGPDEVEIPSVRGMLRADAEDALERAGLKITQIESAHDPDIDSGRVTATDPPEGTVVAPGTEITLYVSDGQVDLPDLRGKQESEARQILVDLGLIPNTVVVETDEFAPGTVLTQDPLPGLVAQRSTITMQIAAERTTVQVPNVVGMTEAEAKAALQAVGLQASTSSQASATVDSGDVISQNPSSGITVAKGTTVALVISTGPLVIVTPDP